jgi:hypothetical protein
MICDRATFYLASILQASGNTTGALFYYRRRWEQWNDAQRWYAIEMEPNDNKLLRYCQRHEEAYVTVMAMARIREAMGEAWHTIQGLYHDAHDICALRAEPLVSIANHWFDLGKHALCYLHASRASHLSYPAWARLTVDTSVYRWRSDYLVAVSGWAIGQYDVGTRAALRVQRYMTEIPSIPTHAPPLDEPDSAMIENHVVCLSHSSLSLPSLCPMFRHIFY